MEDINYEAQYYLPGVDPETNQVNSVRTHMEHGQVKILLPENLLKLNFTIILILMRTDW